MKHPLDLCSALTLPALTLAALTLTPCPASAQYVGRDPAECAQMSTAEQPIVAYEIQAADRGCARIAQRHFGDRRRYDLIHRYNTDLGPSPHRFTPGTYLCLPAAEASAGPAARVTALRQNVRHRRGETQAWQPAALGQDVARGTRVNALDAAFAELTFHDRTVVTLRSDTVVVVYGATSSAVRRSGTEAVLERGSLRTRLSGLRGGQRFEVQTPNSTVELGSGAAVTSVDDASATRVSNHQGRAAAVRSAAGGPAVRLPPGMGSKVLPRQRPTPPRPLPDAPVWVADQTARFVGVAGQSTARGSWAPVEAAGVYRVEIARQADGGELVAQVEVPSSVTRFELHRFPAGTYYARVSTIGRDFFESRPSEPWAFDVELAELRLPGQDEPVEPAFDFIDDVAPPLPIPRGATLAAPDGVRCAWGDGAAARELVAQRLGHVEVRCVDEDDRALGGVTATVVGARLSVVGGPDPSAPLLVARGRDHEATLFVQANIELPQGATFQGGDGITVLDVTHDGEQHEVRLRVGPEAPHLTHLTFGTPAAALAELAVEVRDPEFVPPPPEEPAPEPPPLPWVQAFGTSVSPNTAGLRDVSRHGVGGFVSAAYFSAAGSPERLRGSVGASASLLERQLYIEVARAYDFIGIDAPFASSSDDLYAAAGCRLPLDELDLRFDVGFLFPADPDRGGEQAAQILPTAHLGVVIEDTLLARTRQGAAVEMDRSGDALWISAYGLDVRPIGPLTLGAELDLSVGSQDGELLVLPTVGPTVGLTLDVFLVSAGARFGLTPDARQAFGSYSLFLTVEAGYWFPIGE